MLITQKHGLSRLIASKKKREHFNALFCLEVITSDFFEIKNQDDFLIVKDSHWKSAGVRDRSVAHTVTTPCHQCLPSISERAIHSGSNVGQWKSDAPEYGLYQLRLQLRLTPRSAQVNRAMLLQRFER